MPFSFPHDSAAAVRNKDTEEFHYVLANQFLTVEISPRGRITRVIDIGLGRELILPGSATGSVIYQGYKCLILRV
ncbi:hypothetical protein MJO29_000336 [Puccinia striiformis f. sp. tritici]|uniref:hypothetical protein n=1 Tax=Puccinia striiformis f. sp. tritici TaxID=168172 RepID=UPI002007D132|nr:hypothetical protein Pst134EA_000322 [Puccinia striiformis f. sp. tritici]KAH9473248.1 hypothetical protein Pst134EA_000322 [Puccinia striiformis f. sp. tritici]KAI7967059.1 hypothetical protein MJO29_000336 [Puccinia striiformis f. sp. tritici]